MQNPPISTENRPGVALILGASGMVGRTCLRYLLEHGTYNKVIALVRHPLPWQHPRLECMTVDFDRLTEMGHFPAVDDVFCALGAPMSKLWNRPLVRKVDLHYPLNAAKLARYHGASRMFVVTSAGIGHRSPLHYCRVKARLEDDLVMLGFDAVHIFRPSVLTDHRGWRTPLQSIAGVMLRPFAPLFRGPLEAFRPVLGRAVGYTMFHAAGQTGDGVHTWSSGTMAAIFQDRHRADAVDASKERSFSVSK